MISTMYRFHLPFRLPAILCTLLALSPTLWAGAGSLIETDTGDGSLTAYVHFDLPPSPKTLDNVKAAWTLAGHTLCDATDGQVRLERLILTGGDANREQADFRLIQFDCQSTAPSRGLGVLGQSSIICKDDQNSPFTLAHEMGHLAFGLGDQTLDEDRHFGINPQTRQPYICGIGPGFEPGTTDERNHTIMQRGGQVECVGGGNPGSRCFRNEQCDGGTCQAVMQSEFSVSQNHDPVRGDGVGPCPEAVPAQTVTLSNYRNVPIAVPGPVQVFDNSSFATAEATSTLFTRIRLKDSIGSLEPAELRIFLTRQPNPEGEEPTFLLSAGMSEAYFDNQNGDQVRWFGPWTLGFPIATALAVVIGDDMPPTVTLENLFNGADDQQVRLEFPSLWAAPYEAPPGVQAGFEVAADGFLPCGKDDCAWRWDGVSKTWAGSGQSIRSARQTGQVESDWETMVRHFPFLELPEGLPKEAAPAHCAQPPVFEERLTAKDQILVVLDRSGSMATPITGPLNSEICGDQIDNDDDGQVDEQRCVQSRLSYVQASTRALLDLETSTQVEIGLVSFNEDSRLEAPLSDLEPATAEIYSALLDGLEAEGSTAIGSALQTGLVEFQRPEHEGRRRALLLLTDGENNVGPEPSEVIPDLVQADIQVFTIPIGEGADVAGMAGVADGTRGAMYPTPEMDQLPVVFAEISARLAGYATLMPPKRVNVAIKPWLFPTPEDPREPSPVKLEKIFLQVEPGAKQLVFMLSSRHEQIDTWKLNWTLFGPNGEQISPASPNVTSDPFYWIMKWPEPTPGEWWLEIWAEGEQLQRSMLTAFVEHPSTTFFADAHPKQAQAGDSVRLTAVPGYGMPIEGDVAVLATVERPDGTSIHLPLVENLDPGLFEAEFDQFVGRGAYRVTYEVEVGEAQPISGENIFEGPERLDVDVPAFIRAASTGFTVIDGPFPICTSEDCDGDGIPNKYECGSDTDGDGIPNLYDHDSDSDDVSDEIEGMADLDMNGIADACDPTYPKHYK